MNHCKISNAEVVDYSFCSKWLHAYYKQQTDSRANLATFQELIREGSLSKGMASKMSKSGLTLRHLIAVFMRSDLGEEYSNIRSLLSEKFNGRIRVTNKTPVIEKVHSWLRSNIKKNEE